MPDGKQQQMATRLHSQRFATMVVQTLQHVTTRHVETQMTGDSRRHLPSFANPAMPRNGRGYA